VDRVQPLVGRSREVEHLANVLTADQRTLVVSGDAGVGKTTLLSQLCRDASGLGWRVLRSSCVEAEQPYPYAGLHQLLLALEEHVGGLNEHQRAAVDVAVGRDAGEPAAVLALGTALLDLLAAAGSRTPCLVAIDDASAAVVAFVARRLSGRPAALVCAVRTGEPSTLDTTGFATLQPANTLAGSLCFMALTLAAVCVHAAFVAHVGGPLTMLGLLACAAVVTSALALRRRAVNSSLRGGRETALGHAH